MQWDRLQISSEGYKPSPTKRSPMTRPITAKPHHDPVDIITAVCLSTSAGRKLIAMIVVGMPATTVSKDADMTKR